MSVPLWVQRNVDWRDHTTGQLDSTRPVSANGSDAEPITERD
ncbi:hypothetical protein [Halodesulfurarchaeum formicicum]|nr:hypothetical protein [Halodesulfurarchaeum formicicum]